MPRPRLVLLTAAILAVIGSHRLLAVETLKIRDGDIVRDIVAEIMVEAQNGDLMVQADDGHIWLLTADQILERSSDERALEPVSFDELERRILTEMPAGFKVHRTPHYLIVYNCNEPYARQVGNLFEQLHRGFFTFWKNQRWKLPPPRFPLVAVVLRNHSHFLKYAEPVIGKTAQSVIGYYHLASNRMITFNVPDFERNVSTIIHEGTHQLAYNCGLQQRYADNPMWVSEGLATFFESPDRRNPTKWRSIGRINRVNLARWHRYLAERPSDSLATLLADDKRFRSPGGAAGAYAEGWALTYFLLKTNRKKQFVAYLQELSEGRPLAERTPRERIEIFESAFETTLAELDHDFLKFMRTVR